MRRFHFLFFVLMLLHATVFAQFLPKGLTEEERKMLPLALPQVSDRGFTTPPTVPVRTPAEWEEIDGLCVRWEGTWVRPLLRDIVSYAKEEVTVYIVTQNEGSVTTYLNQGGVNTDNIVFVDEPTNSIWFRDYGQWNIYADEVGELMWTDWIYNRPRPLDDVIPAALADLLDIPLYETTVNPTDLVNTGGNFMVDGFGTGFASELILEENDPNNPYGVSVKSESDIDDIMSDFMGIDRYIKMPTLPYDGIHHIDMHMKLLDEETLLVGEYPSGVADGPQIESNLNYVVNNFMSVYGTPYKVIRVPMPPENGHYPNTNAAYRTYTNSVFVNRTVLVPIYEEQWDTTALRIYREALPGYRVIGLDCNDVIQASGAIHCITKAVASDDPLLISHQSLDDTPYVTENYEVNALIRHASDIESAEVYWTTDTTQGYQSASMTLTNVMDATWTGYIPYQQPGAEVFYYIHAEANSGKEQVRPMTAPAGWWRFTVADNITGIGVGQEQGLRVYPNPTSGKFTLEMPNGGDASVHIVDMTGRTVFQKRMVGGRTQMDVSTLPSGLYLVWYITDSGVRTEKLELLRP